MVSNNLYAADWPLAIADKEGVALPKELLQRIELCDVQDIIMDMN